MNDDEGDETLVRPVESLPVHDLDAKIVGTRVVLANGQHEWALVGNASSTDVRVNQHFLTLALERNGRWFHLARYHDQLFQREYGPEQLAVFLDLKVADLFPIAYDLRPYAQGDPKALCGLVEKDPAERLTRAELIRLSVPRRTDPSQ